MDPQRANDQGVPMAQPPQSVAAGQPLPSANMASVNPLLPAQPQMAPPAAPPAPVPGQQAPAPPRIAAVGQTPVQAADNDVIEVEWIQKAKQIIAETRDDPYKQVQQLNQLKAEYMQKRYNKTVKLPDA